MKISYKVSYKKEAVKFLKKYRIETVKFYKAFETMANDLENFDGYDIKRIVGRDNEYRLRLGKCRALFRVIDNELLILVIDIDSRGLIYK